MAHVVFLRAVNVGGRNTFRPAQLARELAHLDVVNIGAAGTFVVRAQATAEAVRCEIVSRLAFTPDLSVHHAADVVALVERDPFRGLRFTGDRRGWVAALATTPRTEPPLPIATPAGRAWSVRFDAVDGRFAMGIWRRPRGGFVFPSHVVEAALRVRATTRWWETFVKVARVLDGGGASARGRRSAS
jgi:uncharacterized protein (DUF1697 family)